MLSWPERRRRWPVPPPVTRVMPARGARHGGVAAAALEWGQEIRPAGVAGGTNRKERGHGLRDIAEVAGGGGGAAGARAGAPAGAGGAAAPAPASGADADRDRPRRPLRAGDAARGLAGRARRRGGLSGPPLFAPGATGEGEGAAFPSRTAGG